MHQPTPDRPVSIGTRNERSLHSSLKDWYARPGDLLEEKVDGTIVDILREDLIIEIQTRNFGVMKRKLSKLLEYNKVLLVYPVAREKLIIRIDPETGKVLKTRKSPKTGSIYDLFSELVYIPHLVKNRNLSIEVAFIREESVWCDDGEGSWKRKGTSVKDHRLAEVVETRRFNDCNSYLGLLPPSLPQQFTNRELAEALRIRMRLTAKMTYCLKKMGVIRETGRKGRSILLEKST